MDDEKKEPKRKVMVSGCFVNMVPAHDRYVGKAGSGSTVPIAIGRAIEEIFKDERVKRKRVTYPMVFTVTEY